MRTRELIRQSGVDRETLYGWIKRGYIERPSQDGKRLNPDRGWCEWTEEDAARIQALKRLRAIGLELPFAAQVIACGLDRANQVAAFLEAAIE